ncbi:hypothetical protein [Gracilibacillus salinarum]|uniref:Tetratricopeptide repeat protein n=1 Tax=Gracilibacillus salinarum TaxID=2932255 RepID=A0ABY4GHA8_9BACI|nr:hypothetical protein [Gracilibacillus salinarum]UOQ83710.1 hypothetical protein MUN87_13195 [Gracilibacillus salinarum]
MVNTSEGNIKLSQEQISSLHKKAVAGNKKAVQDLHHLLEQARPNSPDNPPLDAYHGSTMILVARDATIPLDKLKWSKSGLKLLDKAVSAEPQHRMIRLLRGKAGYQLPEDYFQRSQSAIEDYTFLIERQIDGEGFLDKRRYFQLIYELGELYSRIGQNGNARKCWLTLKNKSNDPNLLHLLEIKLKELEDKPDVEHEHLLSNLKKRVIDAVESEMNNKK